MLDQETIENITGTSLYIHLHHPYVLEGTEGEEMLELAIALKKMILLVRMPGRENLPIPKLLEDYDNLKIFDGDPEQAAEYIRQLFSVDYPDGFTVASRGYGHPGDERIDT